MFDRRSILGYGVASLASLVSALPALAEKKSDRSAPQVARSRNDFGLRLLAEVSKDAAGQNAVVSPLSVSIALDMLTLASEGRTYDLLLRKRKLAPDHFQQQKDGLTRLTGEGSALVLANSVWLANTLRPKPTFSLALAGAFQANVRSVDFARPETPGAINAWVKTATRDKIPTIVDSLSAETMLAIVNAAYFKARWLKTFDPNATVEAPFALANGQTAPVRMMSTSLDTIYREDEALHSVQLPYEGNRFEMVLVTCKQKKDIKPFLARTRLGGAMQKLGRGVLLSDAEPAGPAQTVAVSLPRFTVQFGRDLTPVMTRLGLGEAFGEDANLGQLGTSEIDRTALIHRAFVEVNEEGTEAAAATAIVTSRAAVPDTRSFIADRPFLFFIRDRETRSIVFSGLVQDPK